MSSFHCLSWHTWDLKNAIFCKPLGVTSSIFLVFMMPTTRESLKKIWELWGTFSIFSGWFDMEDFPSPSTKAALSFALHFLLKVIWNRYNSTMKYFVSGFYHSFWPPIKRVCSFNIAKPFLLSFHDSCNFFL